MERIDNELVEKGRALEKKVYESLQGMTTDGEGAAVDVCMQALALRSNDHLINPVFLRRWSPRALLPEPIATGDLETLFEAARWAPSTYNEQEWRFLYAMRDSAEWPLFFEALTDQNKLWCSNAGALLCICGRNELTVTGKFNTVRSFDCGAAFQNMALQAGEIGLIVHGMAGFSPEIVRKNLQVPISHSIEAMAAIGYPGDPAELDSSLQEKEIPSGRKPLADIVCQGIFSFSD